MNYQFPPDVDEKVREKMASGKYASEDELLRDALEALDVEDEEIKAIQASLTELEQGDPGVLLDEAFSVIRRKYGAHSDG